MLYEIHQSVTENWEASSNWIRTSKLLSTLYHEMQNSNSHERTNICANLYLSSITVYLNIIDVWLSEGRLEDWREEFIIVRYEKYLFPRQFVKTIFFICRNTLYYIYI